MFERIRSIFKKKAEEKAAKELSLDDAEKFFEERLAEKEKSTVEECRELQQGILSRFSDLSSFFTELAAAEIEEERAMSSKVVKDRYTRKALEILARMSGSDLQHPVQSTSISLADVKKFAYDVGDVLNSLSNITPKQAMHIQFFFGEQMSKIALEIEEIIKEAKAMNELIEPVLREKDSMERKFAEISRLKTKTRENEEKIEQLLDEIVELKKSKEGLVPEDLAELDGLRERLKLAMSKRNAFKHRIDAEFSSVDRLLKKYRYHERYALKDIKLLDMYIDEPQEAFLDDEDLKIKKFLEEAVLLATAGELDIDVKTIQRVDSIFDNFDELKRMREENAETLQEIEDLQDIIQKQWLPKVEHNRAVERKIKEIDEKILDNERNHMKTLKENSENENKLTESKSQLSELLSEFSGAQVKIS